MKKTFYEIEKTYWNDGYTLGYRSKKKDAFKKARESAYLCDGNNEAIFVNKCVVDTDKLETEALETLKNKDFCKFIDMFSDGSNTEYYSVQMFQNKKNKGDRR